VRDFRPPLEDPPEASSSEETTGVGTDASAWGTPDAQSGAALPPRPKLNRSARKATAAGVAAAAKGDYAAANASFEQALAADPRAYPAAYNLGIVAERQGKPDAALAFYARALRIQPDCEEAVDATVRIHLRRAEPQRAIDFARPIAQAWQRNLGVQAVLASLLVETGDLDAAERTARAALSRNERFVPALIVLARAAIARGRFELADSILEQAGAIDPKNPDLHFVLGVRHQQEQRLSQAVAEYRRAIELRPDFCEAHIALGLQYMAAGNYEQALIEFETVDRLAPGLPAVRLNYGDALRVNRRWKAARRVLEKVGEEHNLPEAHYNLGLLYMEVGAEYPGLSVLESLERAQREFSVYREQMGARLANDDASTVHLANVQRLVDRERKRIEREQARAKKQSEEKK
jgi:tetratricopeptide (TPR) repeat protein